MKTSYLVLLLLSAGTLRSQVVNTPGELSPEIAADRSISYVPGNGGPNEREWLKVTTTTNLQGQVTVRTNVGYVETATGLNYLDPGSGQWLPAKEEIDGYPGGGIATNGQTTVIFENNANTAVAVDMAVGGKRWQSHVIGLSYLDLATGSNVLIAEVLDCQGVIVPPNSVVYQSAFTDFKADLVYNYTKAGLSQWVVLRERPPLPENYGLSSASTVLQVLTEFVASPQPNVRQNEVPSIAGGTLSDQNLDFGVMSIGPGQAFATGEDPLAGIPVAKQWAVLDGRTVLAESIRVADAAGQLDQLPLPAQASVAPVPGSIRHIVSAKRLLPGPRFASTTREEMKVAQLPLRQRGRGFTIDYTTISTSQTNYDFQANLTYYLSGNCSLFGTNNIFEGGVVLKFASNVTLTVNSPVTWLGGDYRPVVMLSKDDNSAGDTISGSTGAPKTNFYAAAALFYNATAAGTNLVLKGLRVLNAQTAVAISGGTNHSLTDVQIVNCRSGLAATNAGFYLGNALFANVLTNFTGSSGTGVVEQLTSDRAAWLNSNLGTNLFLTNCLLVGVTNLGSCTTQSVATVSNSSGIFQSAAWGNHYLADGSPYRNAGTTNISTNMLAELPLKTTSPAIVYSNTIITSYTNLSLNPQAQRDYDAPDLGWHYCPLDYVFAGSTTTVSIAFAPGTAVGWFRTSSGFSHAGYGLHLSDSNNCTFAGTEQQPCYWVRCNTVTEADTSGGVGAGAIESSTYPNSPAVPVVYATFLRCSALTWGNDTYFRDDFGILAESLSHCEFWTGTVGGYGLIGNYTNCLFDRASFWHSPGDSNYPALYFRNCFWHGGVISFNPNFWVTSLRDCVLDNVGITLTGSTNLSDYAYNGFVNGSNRLIPTNSNDVVPAGTWTWLPGPLGPYYQADASPFVNAGDTSATNIGLYHFTVTTDQTIDGANTVSLGYHYVAVDGNGNPLDYNGDGIPDYLQDANGNGLIDSGEIGWNASGDPGLQVIITRPKSNSIIP